MSETKFIWLVGNTISELNSTKLPIALDVMKLFFHYQRIEKKTVAGSAKNVAKDLQNIWIKTSIPTLLPRNIALSVESLKKNYETLKKSRYRRTEKQIEREDEFQENMKKMFNICSHAGLVLSKEQQQFLDDQQALRILDVDSLKPLQGPLIIPKTIETSLSDSEESNENDSEGSDFEDSLSESERHILNPPCTPMLNSILNSTDVTSAIDRVNMNDREFTIVAAAMARKLGENINESAFSISTVSRKRSHNRKLIVDEIKRDFFLLLEQDTFGLVLHFDGKKLPNSTDDIRENRTLKVERIAIVVTGRNIEKILGVIPAKDGTGATMAEAADRVISEWDEWNQRYGTNKSIRIRDRIFGMVFDTTSANTGIYIGACKLFEDRYMKRKLLHFACRHHVYEIVVGGIFKKLFGKSDGPNVSIFERFKATWSKIRNKKFKGLDKIHFKTSFAKSQRKETIEFLLHALSSDSTYTPRGDYKELIELCLLVLGHQVEGFTFKAPGPTHHARWMAKVIYSFKIYLFRDHFQLSEEEISNFEEMVLFASLIYVRAWIQCPLASDAPLNDLQFFKLLKKYAIVNETVSETAIEKFGNHLWYLGSELVVLSLFSKNITSKEKLQILKKMKTAEDDWKCHDLRLQDVTNLDKKKLSDLIGCQSMNAIKCLQLNLDFMYNLKPEKWTDSDDYNLAKSFVDDINVVNDAAERSLALMTDFNDTLTRKETGKQLVLQVVEDHRKRVKNCTKETLISYKTR